MAEPDHVFVRPLPNLAREKEPAAFPFFYIKPSENEKIVRKFYPEEKGPVTNVDPIGNSPVIIKKVVANCRCVPHLIFSHDHVWFLDFLSMLNGFYSLEHSVLNF